MRKPFKVVWLVVAALCMAVVVIVVLTNRVRLDDFTGHYAPTFSPDGGSVVLLERRVREWLAARGARDELRAG